MSQRLFDTIADEPDMNRNMDVSLNISCPSNEPKAPADSVKREMGVTRSHTQPEIYFHANSWNTKVRILFMGEQEFDHFFVIIVYFVA